MSPRRRRRGERRPAVYLLPNLLTTASMLLGFWSITQSIAGHWDRAGWGIMLAAVADLMDGRVARATHSTSRFGLEYDSLADVISFGVAPAVLAHQWVLAPMGNRRWIVAALFMICAALRLARFNVQQEEDSSDRYQGLPTTFAGGMVAVIVWYVGWLGLQPPFGSALGLAITASFVSIALLMVSFVPYPSLKGVPVRGRHAFTTLVSFVLFIVLLLLYGDPAFFAFATAYILSGPLLWLWGRCRPQPAPSGEEAADV